MMKLLTVSIINQILKVNDNAIFQNFLLASDHIGNTLPLSLQNIFIPVKNIHEHRYIEDTKNIE